MSKYTNVVRFRVKTGQQDDTITIDELDLRYAHLLPQLLGKRKGLRQPTGACSQQRSLAILHLFVHVRSVLDEKASDLRI